MYLNGKYHEIISENECLIYAEKRYPFFFWNIYKNVKYKCIFKSADISGYDIPNYKYFSINVKSISRVDSYERYILDIYMMSHDSEFSDKREILKNIRKQKLDKLINN